MSREHDGLHSRRADLPRGKIVSSFALGGERAKGSTRLVDRRRLGRFGETGADDDLAGGRLAGASLEDLTKVDVLDLVGLDVRRREDALDGGDTELSRGNLGEDALERADGRARLGATTKGRTTRGGSVDAVSRREGRDGTHGTDDEDFTEARGRGRLCRGGRSTREHARLGRAVETTGSTSRERTRGRGTGGAGLTILMWDRRRAAMAEVREEAKVARPRAACIRSLKRGVGSNASRAIVRQ